MNSATKTRKQRRMEKKQAVLLLILVLVVSLASFALGVMVGSRGAKRELAQKQQAAEKILVAKAPEKVVPAPQLEPATPTPAEPSEAAQEETKLTFYDKLAKESPPLGSGINLPPPEAKPAPAAKPPLELPEQPIVKKETVAVAAAPAPAQPEPTADFPASILPQTDPAGKYALQVGSFSTAADAGRLKKRLAEKGYPTFVAEADLAAKGIWYRVKIGPYADSATAKKMQQLMEKKENLKGFVSRL